ncbi:MAG: peptidylprolyl isomerase [Proteobacteria bacterium]|nr:peptidylprolyl isomerase [Pseudomonadota bacterium]
MRHFKRLLREPLFHFLVCGSLLFGLYTIVSPPVSVPRKSIVVGPERIAQLTAGFEGVWRRPPDAEELRRLIEMFVREEVYYREALALGLDRDDTIIRRRLQQKMEFLTDSGADLLQPDESDLETYYAANEQKFRHSPRIALQQIYLGQKPMADEISKALTALRTDSEADPAQWGERTLLPAQVALSAPNAIDGVFGTGFFDELENQPVNQWSGPVESGYGLHLVRVLEREPGRLRPLVEVREVLEREWKAEKAQEMREEIYFRLSEGYDIELPEELTVPPSP